MKKAPQKFTSAPKKAMGTKQVASGMGGMFGNVTPKKAEPDAFAPTKAMVKPKKGALKTKLAGVRL